MPPSSSTDTWVIGIDPSWTGLALTALRTSGERGPVTGCHAEVVRTSPDQFPTRAYRLRYLRDAVEAFLRTHPPRLVAVEGYAFGAQNGRELAGELGGVLRMLVLDVTPTTQLLEVPPTVLKKFVTGRGNATKAQMAECVGNLWQYLPEDHNAADSYGLARIGVHQPARYIARCVFLVSA